MMRKLKWYLPIACAVFLLDRLTKILAQRMTGSVTLIEGVLGLRYAQNTGMAFSLLSGQSWLLGILSAALLAAGWLLLRRHPLGPVSCTAAMLILGGALGNAVDRLLAGYVVDMIDILLFPFAVFNVADMCLVIGVGIMILSLLLCPKEWNDA